MSIVKNIEDVMRAMVLIIDDLEKLPKECPEVLKSATYNRMMLEREELIDLLEEQTAQMNKAVTKVEEFNN